MVKKVDITELEVSRRRKLVQRNMARKGTKVEPSTYFCIFCKREFLSGHKRAKFCSKKCSYDYSFGGDEIEKKALTISSPIRFGSGKRAFFSKLIRSNLGTGCRYCTEPLTLKNIGLDHIKPFGTVRARKDALVKEVLDRSDNLQIICKRCNQMKGELPHEDFVKLLDFLATNQTIGSYVKRKLGQSAIMWRFKRKFG